jgi:ribosomal protein S18 acetylase RimI-like enzyme
MLLIRQYKQKDNAAVKALHFTYLEQFGVKPNNQYDKDLDDIEGCYLNNNGDFLVGLVDNEIVAIGAVKKISTTKGVIKRIRVRENVQRKGYGEAILLRLVERASELGYSELYLDTMAQNIPAQRLFEKHGFIEKRREKLGFYDMVFYGKSLNPK